MPDPSLQKYALIVGGGIGSRMQSELPKQFMSLAGQPVLMHTMQAFAALQDRVQIVVVLPKEHISTWDELCSQMTNRIAHEVVAGGETRFHSVRNGLEKIPAGGLVAIHDAVRPLIDAAIIIRSFDVAAEKGNAITAVKLKDSLRELTLTGGTRNRNRENYYLVQTPQTFQTDLVKKAYAESTHYNFTDDAGVLEEMGEQINLVEGSYKNIKITTPEDLLIAETFLRKS